MALTTSEIDSLRFHLGYGNIGFDAFPYTSDGFLATFQQVISPNLSTGTETTASTSIAAGSIVVVTPVAMTDIVLRGALVVDTGDQAEIVTVKAVTATTFTAHFKKAHASSGYPVETMSGVARLRVLLSQADTAWQALTSSDISDDAGLKSVDKGDVVWFGGFQVLKDKLNHWKAIVSSISSLVRVAPVWASKSTTRLEAW